jgi:hypothetical protein
MSLWITWYWGLAWSDTWVIGVLKREEKDCAEKTIWGHN